MKTILRNFLINLFCFLIFWVFLPAVDFSGRMEILICASLALALINLLVKPVLNLLFLPLNLVTLGSFQWIVNILTLFLVSLIIPGFRVKSFVFQGTSFHGFVFPSINVSLFWSYLFVSLLISVISNIIFYSFK